MSKAKKAFKKLEKCSDTGFYYSPSIFLTEIVRCQNSCPAPEHHVSHDLKQSD
jgi:hypothetical protein